MDVDGAIAKYREAIAMDDTNAEVFWKLSRAQERKEDWTGVTVSLARASQLAPAVASYRYRLGYAWIKLAQAGDASAYEQARDPLSKCRELDPRLSDCPYLLGVAEEWTEHPQQAAEHYREAVARDAAKSRYALALARLYRTFRHELEAEGVLAEAAERLQSSGDDRDDAVRLLEAWARLALVRGDFDTARVALSRAAVRVADADPYLSFVLGELYGFPAPQHPLDAARARAALMAFAKRVCHGAQAAHFYSHCQGTQSMLQALPDVSANPTPLPVASGPSPLPKLPPPQLTVPTIRSGDAFTVAGASYYLRAPQHERYFDDRELVITGYITKTNLAGAPACAVHRAGQADPDNCFAEIPRFWLGDAPDAAPRDCIQVLGWASNYAQIYDAIRVFDSARPEPYRDTFWGVELPNPLPARGARVMVRGQYGRAFAKASSGLVTDDVMGIVDFQSMQELEPSLELATLPGVKRKR